MPEVNSLPISEDSVSPMDLAEAQLQQELGSMFDIDTQTYLHTYFSLVQQLQQLRIRRHRLHILDVGPVGAPDRPVGRGRRN